VWLADSEAGYSVGGAYYMLSHLVLRDLSSDSELVWNNFVPLKINTFAWSLLSDRLPTKSNLDFPGRLHNDSAMCSTEFYRIYNQLLVLFFGSI
jgi:hypothetical protein